jgi:hypothetical protein
MIQYNLLTLFNTKEVDALERTLNELANVGWKVESMQVDNGRFYVLISKLF